MKAASGWNGVIDPLRRSVIPAPQTWAVPQPDVCEIHGGPWLQGGTGKDGTAMERGWHVAKVWVMDSGKPPVKRPVECLGSRNDE